MVALWQGSFISLAYFGTQYFNVDLKTISQDVDLSSITAAFGVRQFAAYQLLDKDARLVSEVCVSSYPHLAATFLSDCGLSLSPHLFSRVNYDTASYVP